MRGSGDTIRSLRSSIVDVDAVPVRKGKLSRVQAQSENEDITRCRLYCSHRTSPTVHLKGGAVAPLISSRIVSDKVRVQCCGRHDVQYVQSRTIKNIYTWQLAAGGWGLTMGLVLVLPGNLSVCGNISSLFLSLPQSRLVF